MSSPVNFGFWVVGAETSMFGAKRSPFLNVSYSGLVTSLYLKILVVHFYRPQTKFAKVMFLQVSVCPHRGAWFYLGGHAWFYLGGVWFYPGGVCGFIWGGRAWFYLGGHAWFYLGGHVWFSGGRAWFFQFFQIQ